MKYRNFTGDDLVRAEADMQKAWNTYQAAVDAYNIPASVDPGSYASRVKKTIMDSTREQYDVAKLRYDDIVKGFASASNAIFQSDQQNFVSDALQTASETGSTSGKNYTTLIYVAIALALAWFILK